jgi:hypothetical protein
MKTNSSLVLVVTFLLAGFCATSTRAQNLFVSNLQTGSIWDFGPGGNLITSSSGMQLSMAQGLDFDNSGNL